MAKRDRKMTAASITPETLSNAISDALQRKLLHVRNPYHWLSERYGWGQRKAKAIVRGEYCPTASDLLTLMAEDDDVYECVLAMIKRDELTRGQRARIKEILEEG